MEIKLKYGKETIQANVRLFDCLGELVSKHITTLQPAEKILQDALAQAIGTYPFSRLFRRAKGLLLVLPAYSANAGIHQVLPHVLDRLNHADVPDQEIKLLVAKTHGPAFSEEELINLVGRQCLQRVDVFQHDCHATRQLEYVGETRCGIPVLLNRLLLDAEQIMILSSIEHHFITGYDGGPRVIIPGCAGYETISRIFSLAIDFEHLKLQPWCMDGKLDGNPVHKTLQEAYRCLSAKFGVYPIMNSHHRIISVFTGHPLQAHAAGQRMVDSLFKIPIRRKADLTIVSCGGAPRDDNFLVAYRALHHAAYATKPGGTIVFVAACPQGIGSETFLQWFDYRESQALLSHLHSNFSLEATLALATMEKISDFNIIMVSELAEAELRKMGFIFAPSLQEAIDMALDTAKKRAATYIMPEGFQTVPFFCDA